MKYREETVRFVDSYDFDKTVKDEFGREYQFVADEECGNDSTHRFQVDGELDKWEQKQVNEFVETGEGSYLARNLLNALCARSVIPAGTYVVEVCW